MEFEIEKKTFLKPLGILQTVVERRSSIPALGNILIESEDNQIRLITTDLETTLISHVSCSIKKEGKICVSARKLFEIIKELPETQISINGLDNYWAKIACENALFNLSGLNPTEFPTLPSYSEDEVIAVESLNLGEMIEKVIFAASTEESRYNLNGIFFQAISLGDKSLTRMVATDGHRLALIERESPQFTRVEKGVIIPKRGLSEVRKLVAENPGEVKISVTENSFLLKVSSFLVIIRLIDGEFPDYQQVIPTQNDKIIKLSKEGFSSCLRRISAISTDRVEGVKFSIKKGAIELYCSNQAMGDAKEVFPAIYDGNEFNIGFNARYILDALNAIEEDEFLIKLKDEGNGAVIKPAIQENPLYVIMPMRI